MNDLTINDCFISDDIISKTGNQNVVLKQLDVSDLSSVRKFATEINEEEPQIHVLVSLFMLKLTVTVDRSKILFRINENGLMIL